MSKIGIKAISLRNILLPMNLKREILLFDKLYVDKLLYKAVSNVANSITADQRFSPLKSHLNFNIQNIEYLFNEGLIDRLRKVVPAPYQMQPKMKKEYFFLYKNIMI
jgi:hypothetical protein